MTDTNDQFLVEDDEILASILEESLRHYNEVEVPLRCIAENEVSPAKSIVEDELPSVQNEAPQQSNNSNSLPKLSRVAPPVVIDLCQSPKKCTTVQSRLSHFFTKPKSDKIYDREETNSKLENQTDKLCIEINSSPVLNNNSISSSPAIFYKEPDANGFHLSSGSHYVYPSNFPVREYQMGIIKTALFHNTLVSLPTGMGKTFIAAVVMYNFYRWYPMGKIIFMAPTRPLVAQQIEACHSIMGIPREMTFEMTGNIPPEQRYLAWNKYRVFFLTPQVLANDLSLNKCPSETFRCIIVDEAHRATKDYAYVQVLKRLAEENRVIRIVGLSATPGTNVEAVTEVIKNLNISKLEFRTDESPDVAKYTNKKDVECISVKLTNTILDIRTQFLMIYDKYLKRLKQYHALNGNVANLTKFQIFTAKQKFLTSNNARDMPKSLIGCLINDFTICMSLAYALELLTIYGVKVFYLQSLEMKETHKCLSNDADFRNLLHSINKELNSQDLTWSHPKLFELKKIVQNYFGFKNVEASSKIIIFCQYRLVVVEVFELLKTFGSSVKPVMFVGQSLKEKGGLRQKEQLEVMSRFKSGDFNVLIATSVAEEGLDIGDVDLIICLEANKSPIKFVQRLGRTGRKRSGKCVTLLTEGKEQIKYNSSVSSSKTLVIKMLKNKAILSKLAPEGPRLVPKHIHPQCLMIHVKEPEELFPEKKKLKGKRKAVENIMRYVEPIDGQNEVDEDGEDGLDVFQNNIDKPKRRSKKRKTVEFDTNDNGCTKIESTKQKNTDIDCEHHMNDYYYEAPEINEQGVTDRTLDHFVDEEKVFNEWLKSCMQTNTIVLNSSFLELLNFFTDRGQCDIELFNGKPTDDMFTRQSRVGKIFECPSVSGVRTVRANDQPMRNTDHLSRLCDDVRPGGYTGCSQVASTSAAREINDYTDPEDMFDGHTDHSNFMQPIGIRTSAICDGSHETKPEQNSRTGKLNFNDLFKSQLADGYTDDFIVGNTSLPVRPISVEIDDDNSPANITTGAVVRDDDQDEDDEVMGNVDFEELFKSQRADRFIEKYSEEIVAERPNDDHLSVVCSGGGKKAETCHEEKIDLLFDSQRSDDDEADEIMGNIDLEKLYNSQRSNNCKEKESAAGRQNVDRSIANGGRRSPVVCVDGKKAVTFGHQPVGKMDFSVLYKNQRSDGYIEDFMVRNTPRVQPSNADDRILFHIDDDQDKDDKVMGNIDSEKLFKSQRAAKGMRIDEIDKISAKRPNVNRSIINSGRRSPIVCGGALDKVDYDALFKSQRSDEYIEDYTDKSVAKIAAEKVGVADDWPRSDVGVEDDDVISLNSSQEFFSCRPSKKATQTKLTGHVCTDRAIEIIDLSSPPPSSSSTAAASAASLPIAVDRFPTDCSASTSRVGGGGLLKQTNDDDDMDFMFIDYNSDGDVATDIFTQKHRDGGDEDVFTQKLQDDGDTDFFTQKKRDSSGSKAAVSLPLSPVASAAKLPLKIDVTKRAGHSTQSYDNGMMPFNIMKAARLVDLLKPGLSMKRNTTAAESKRQVDKGSTAVAFKRKVDNGSPVAALKRQADKVSPVAALKRQFDKGSPMSALKRQVDRGSPVAALKRRVNDASPVAGIKRQFDNGSMAALALKRKVANGQSPADDMSPIHAPNGQRRRPQFSQSTPKVTEQPKQRRRETVTTATTTVTTAGKVNSLLTSSSDSDNFVGYGRIQNTTSPRRRVKKKRRRKPKKKLLFIDDEADVSNCYGDGTNFSKTSSDNDDDDDDDQNEFDSSFIDDDHEKSDPSKSMTKQYLQSVKSQANTRGVFKIPQLTRQHFNIDVYSQMDDRNVDNNYEEDSFCVEDASDLNSTSSTTNTSAHRTSDERPSKPPPSRKRKRIILSPRSSDSSDNSPGHRVRRKRGRAKTSLDFS
ncbi:uncharacterized protein LOC132934371 isoform X2 [Metopolophium dirhodum]|uniref:uncharacterized protein LOC132934371 isoform X2 n=1 Tax=Metopolophium dirhodum TaxID=44670 RepID=UPI0029905C2B|nr:uncharacterized protein LOC132934371 isoform X2 [Metopolophium dirhodum]